jgi:ferredoxin-thioredoxin reductase catalytic chain
MPEPRAASLDKMWKYVRGFAEKSGTTMHPNPAVSESVVKGLAMHLEDLGKPLCPCNFYKDKAAEAKLRRWICACDEMQMYKYCHCLLFVREDGMPITEYLPEGHEGREVYFPSLFPSCDVVAFFNKAPDHRIGIGWIRLKRSVRPAHYSDNQSQAGARCGANRYTSRASDQPGGGPNRCTGDNP